jgi:2-oxoglutarate/2-oxoacid ferredoxin oxidoreductase subunit alpha
MEVNLLIGGAAGQGMDTITHLLGKALTREGYGVLLAKDYMSRVRGGHNFSWLRVAEATPGAAPEQAHILVALNEETYRLHQESLLPDGKVIFDPGLFSLPTGEQRGIPVRLKELAQEAGGAVMLNTVAVGAVLVLLGLQTATVEKLLGETFAGRDELIQQNKTALQAGYTEASKTCDACIPLPPRQKGEQKLFLDGNQALGMSALASGCRFFSAYPMTPSTGIMTYLANKQSHGIVVEQAEDEIAAVNMVLGASFTGVRAMTATSGGGFALMVEGLSLAGMTETPLVIVLAMRPGPATGLPTRTEQGDLDFALYGGHGTFPRAVLSATSLEDAFYRLNKAFDLAERFQIPVIFLSDQHFADTARTVSPYDFSRLQTKSYLVKEDELVCPYQRYQITPDGISPRALPGQFPGEVVLADSDEHDEAGHIIEDALRGNVCWISVWPSCRPWRQPWMNLPFTVQRRGKYFWWAGVPPLAPLRKRWHNWSRQVTVHPCFISAISIPFRCSGLRTCCPASVTVSAWKIT